MKTTFTARHIRLHPRLREIVQTKLAKLERVLPGRAEARVVVTGGRQDVGVEVTVVGRRGTFTATARAADQPSAAQDVMDRVAAQVVKTNTKVKGVKKRTPSAVRSPAVWPADQPAEPRTAVEPRRETFSPRAMFEEDALAAFAASRREVLVFRGPTFDNALRFLYRRRDGTLGLVVPEKMMQEQTGTKRPLQAGGLQATAVASLGLRLVAGHKGLERPIDWPRVQKPGLAIAGFTPYVKPNRVQILGESEFAFLKTLPAGIARERLDAFTALPIPCVVVTKGIDPGPVLTGLCRRRRVPLFVTSRMTSIVIEGLTAFLEESLAPRATLHGTLLEVGGLGTLLLGESGVGKSECALALVQRGHRLVADDLVVVQRFPNDVLI